MSAIFIRLNPSDVAGDTGRDVVQLADGLITIRAVRVRKGKVHLLIIAPEDISVKRGDKNGNKINNDCSVTMER